MRETPLCLFAASIIRKLSETAFFDMASPKGGKYKKRPSASWAKTHRFPSIISKVKSKKSFHKKRFTKEKPDKETPLSLTNSSNSGFLPRSVPLGAWEQTVKSSSNSL